MAATPSRANTGAVVVAYNPDADLAERLRAIRSQFDAVLVVDNSGHAPPQWLADAVSLLGLQLVSNERNVGVGAALNQGLDWARELGFDWLATFDQDSTVYETFIEGISEAHEQCPERDLIAIIGPNYVESRRKELWVAPTPDQQDWMEVVCLITSGSLVNLKAAETLGPFRADFFIDLIDYEYCLRARSKGLKVVLATTPLMEHAVGEPTWVRLLWKKNLTTPNHTPLRHYYFTRNHLAVIARYLLREPGPVLQTIRTRMKEVVLVICCEQGKLGKLGAMARGVFDALLGRMGQAGQEQAEADKRHIGAAGD